MSPKAPSQRQNVILWPFCSDASSVEGASVAGAGDALIPKP